MEYVLGIDVGTNSTKTGLFNLAGRFVGLEHGEYPIDYPRKGWAEQNPEHWWEAVTKTVRAVTERHNAADRVRSLSLSTQGGVTLLLDDGFRPLYPGVSWFDARASEIVPLLSRDISLEDLYHSCGFPSLGRLNFSQIVWFREKRPELYKRCAHFGSAVDFLNQRLTGTFAIDISNLAHNSFLDMEKRDYSDRLLAIAGLSREQLPTIVPSGTPVGTLTRKAAAELGLSRAVTVVSGAHDQYCANIGAGAVNVGDCVLSAGTAWALLATADRPLYDNQYRVFPGIHAYVGKFGLMTAVSGGGNSLTWFRDSFAGGSDFRQLDEAAGDIEAGSSGLIFIPQLNARSGKGAFLGIDNVHTQSHFTRSVMEGVALFNQLSLARIRELGLSLRRLVMVGGGAKSTVWPQIVADMAQLPVSIPDQLEAPCAGAGILALAGAGVFESIEEACRRLPLSGRTVKPDATKEALYAELAEKASAILNHI